jgi:hypothetical protein
MTDNAVHTAPAAGTTDCIPTQSADGADVLPSPMPDAIPIAVDVLLMMAQDLRSNMLPAIPTSVSTRFAVELLSGLWVAVV